MSTRLFAPIRESCLRVHARRATLLVLIATAVLLALSAPASADTWVVTNTNDDGAHSLRWAIDHANSNPNADLITFDLSGCPCTITLASQLPKVTDTLAIMGPGADQLTVSGNNAVRVLEADLGVSLTLEGLTIADGAHDTMGAGVYTQGPLTVTDCVFAGNSTVGSGDQRGGAIYFHNYGGTLTVAGSTFVNNTAHSLVAAGGAIYVYGNANITNSTFSGNTTTPVDSWGDGSAVYFWGESQTMTMTHCTVYSNTSFSDDPGNHSPGAVYVGSGTATLKNTIIASNIGGNCGGDGTITDGGGNLQFGDTTCGATIPVADPTLGPLTDNGGPTPTMALLQGSPAVDACSCTTVATDQRRMSRPFDYPGMDNGGLCDSGAYEASLWRVFLPTVLQDVQ